MRDRKDEGRVLGRLKRRWEGHWVRNESWASVGMTDINGCRHGHEVWVESKDLGSRKNLYPDSKLKIGNLRKSQIAWITARVQAGGAVFFGILLNDQLYLVHGRHLEGLLDGITFDQLQFWSTPVERLFVA